MTTPVADDAGLQVAEPVTFLVLQRRIPETHSATPAEHQWHDMEQGGYAVDVSLYRPMAMLSAAEGLLKRAPERSDTIYRVILREKMLIERVVRP